MNHDSKAVTPWFVYVVRCADDTFYTGITTNTERRMVEHNAGLPSGARYTRSRRPVTLAYVEGAASRAVATQRERAIKKLDRRRKLELCKLPGQA